ncbi:4-amino-4-deoxy-L-arabinose transferase-like glycosyltransferase [Agrobacterium vitis]|nr:4-amino-4-deoxy-L-arabinose transferase-like glycosyltransferase [Agrobacterium vitis]MBE1438448.1 4-amino-4-deoxy-L-arabinose transferase-like glycosyltransferase [Agrobacterium vitis]
MMGMGKQFGSRAILLFIGAFVVALTLHATLSRVNLDGYGDMAENYAWGVLWQWGYFKHPPLFGWLVAGWFSLFPKTDFFYYLFAALNAAATLVLIWRIAARYGSKNYQLFVVLAAVVVPALSFQAIKYNANTAMTPIWAAIFLFYLRGLEKQRLADAVILGLLATAAMLTKYYSAVLLVTLLIHAIADVEARKILLSKFGAVAAVVSIIAFVPHFIWLVNNDFLPIVYADEQGEGGVKSFVLALFKFLGGVVAYMLPALLLAGLTRRRGDGQPLFWWASVRELKQSVEGRALLYFGGLTIPVTIIFAALAGADLSVVWAIPVFLSVVVLFGKLVPPQALEQHLSGAFLVGVVYLVVIVAIAPFLKGQLTDRGGYNKTMPLQQMSVVLDDYWDKYGGGTDNFVIGGEALLANSFNFYSRHKAITLENNSFDIAKGYIDRQSFDRRGFILICPLTDQSCFDMVNGLRGTRTDAFVVDFKLPDFKGAKVWAFRAILARPQQP